MKTSKNSLVLYGTILILSLFTIPTVWSALNPPLPPELEEGPNNIVKSKQWAIMLGKALFWDQQVGSNGIACASCHYHAGADTRLKNSLSPGFLQEPDGDTHFGSIANYDGEPVSGGTGFTKSGTYDPDATYELKPEDFPLHHLADYKDRNSDVLITTNDVISSSGQFDSTFFRVRRIGPFDKCGELNGDIFHAGYYPARQVEPRNTPTTINAVFSYANFWDGRANNLFNGVGVFGLRDVKEDLNKRLIVLDGGIPKLTYLQIRNASLASQAVGPPLSEREMSCEGRAFPDVGRKILLRIPLALQKVHPQDSVLGPYRNTTTGRGLKPQYLYSELIKKAFNEKYWNTKGRFEIVDGQLKKTLLKGYNQMEQNFSMFWGISIMLYEASLVSDQSRFDVWNASCNPLITNPGDPLAVPIANPIVTCRNFPDDPTAPEHGGFTAQEVLGFAMFNNGGVGIRNAGNISCNGCHPINTGTFSEANFLAGQTFVPVERSRVDDRGPGTPHSPPSTTEGAVHDRGFFNIGVTPTSFDRGNGGVDIYGNPLSVSRMFLQGQAFRYGYTNTNAIDPSGIADPCNAGNLIEGGFGTPTAGRYPGCNAANNPAGLGTVDPNFNWLLEREMVDGSFKTPGLRNVGLTPPYFHNGAYSTLRQAVEFYARGGSRRDKTGTGDTSGTDLLVRGRFP